LHALTKTTEENSYPVADSSKKVTRFSILFLNLAADKTKGQKVERFGFTSSANS
ncbi:3144_t:CDS:2, partial [Dentiscutata erythropus]